VGRLCTICSHPERQAIDAALLVHEAGYRNIARRFSVDYTVLFRHAQTHLREQIRESKALSEQLRADNLLAKLAALDERTLQALDTAEQQGDLRMVFTGVVVSRGNIEAFARLGPMSEVEQRLRALEMAKAQQEGGSDGVEQEAE